MTEENTEMNVTGAQLSAGAKDSRRAKPDPEQPVRFPKWIFTLAMAYLIVLIAWFVLYETSPALRHGLPTTFGNLPAGIVWFGAMGAVIASLRDIFIYNGHWKESSNYRYVARPLFGAVTGSIGALSTGFCCSPALTNHRRSTQRPSSPSRSSSVSPTRRSSRRLRT